MCPLRPGSPVGQIIQTQYLKDEKELEPCSTVGDSENGCWTAGGFWWRSTVYAVPLILKRLGPIFPCRGQNETRCWVPVGTRTAFPVALDLRKRT